LCGLRQEKKREGARSEGDRRIENPKKPGHGKKGAKLKSGLGGQGEKSPS